MGAVRLCRNSIVLFLKAELGHHAVRSGGCPLIVCGFIFMNGSVAQSGRAPGGTWGTQVQFLSDPLLFLVLLKLSGVYC